MGYSRGASALGVGVALGEIEDDVGDEHVLRSFDLFSSVASTSAGIELMHNVVIVLGNSASSASDFEIGHAVMRDAIDSAAVIDALTSVGLKFSAEPVSDRQLVNIFAKAEASPSGSVRGFRHTMLEDTDISATRHARAAVGGLISGLSGTPAVYISGGAEHQGPAEVLSLRSLGFRRHIVSENAMKDRPVHLSREMDFVRPPLRQASARRAGAASRRGKAWVSGGPLD